MLISFCFWGNLGTGEMQVAVQVCTRCTRRDAGPWAVPGGLLEQGTGAPAAGVAPAHVTPLRGVAAPLWQVMSTLW